MTRPMQTSMIEDDGLAAMMTQAAPPSVGARTERGGAFGASEEDGATGVDPTVLQRVRDVLQSALMSADQRWALDPFSPADERYRLIEEILRAAVFADRARNGPLSAVTPTPQMVRSLYAQTIGWGPAQPYLDDPLVTEVKIAGSSIFVQEQGKPFVRAAESFASPTEVVQRALLLASILGVQLDEAQPQRSLPVSYGTRMHVTIPPRARNGALVCIRRGRSHPWKLRDLTDRGMVNHEVGALLQALVDARCSFLIAGRTGSGKTTVLESLINSAGGHPHIIVIEDNVSEIRVDETTRYVTYLNANTDGSAGDYARTVREVLRQTPDIACPGETRGAEAGATIQLALTGHQVLTTLHAVDPETAVTRLASLAAAPGGLFYESRYHDALADVVASFQIVVVARHLESLAHYGRRIVETITAVDGLDEHGRPVLRPLAIAHEDDDGVRWDVFVDVDEDGKLRMRGDNVLPRPLERAMRFASSSFMARTAMLTHVRIARAREQVRLLLPQNNIAAAVHVVETAWRETRAGRIWELTELAREIAEAAPEAFAAEAQRAAEVKRRFDAAIGAYDWSAAQRIVDGEAAQSIMLAALMTPTEGWRSMLMRIRLGMEHEMMVQRRIDDAAGLCDGGLALQSLRSLESLDVDRLAPRLSIAVAALRVRALRMLAAQGMASAEAVAIAEKRLESLERRKESPHGVDA